MEARQYKTGIAAVGALPTYEVPGWKVLLRGLRTHQWSKNLLLFAPLVASHRVFEGQLLLRSWVAFLALSCCASGAYIVNDLFDLSEDRRHPIKRARPLAAGKLGVSTALFISAVAFLLAFAIGSSLGGKFLGLLAFYVGTTTLYSFSLKRIPLLDVLVLVGFYAVRIQAGSLATGIEPSDWLIVFAMFFFLSLALLKRFDELGLSYLGELPIRRLGYVPEDRNQVMVLGYASAALSVLVLALYVHSPEAAILYHTPRVLWFLCPMLLLWLHRLWLEAGRGRMCSDPVLYVIFDKKSYPIFLAAVLILFIAKYA